MSLLTSALQKHAKKTANEIQKSAEANEHVVEFDADPIEESIAEQQHDAISADQIERPTELDLAEQEQVSEPIVEDETVSNHIETSQQKDLTAADIENASTAAKEAEKTITEESNLPSQKDSQPHSNQTETEQPANNTIDGNIQLKTQSVFSLPKKTPIKRKKFYWILAIAVTVCLIAGWFLFDYYLTQNGFASNDSSLSMIDPTSVIENDSDVQTTPSQSSKQASTQTLRTVFTVEQNKQQISDKTASNKNKEAEIENKITLLPATKLAEDAKLSVGEISSHTNTVNKAILVKRKTMAQPDLHHLSIAYTSLAGEHLDKATWHYQQVLIHSPNHPNALAGLATIQMRKGLHKEARLIYQQLLNIDPDSVIAKSGLLTIDSKTTPKTTVRGLRKLLNEDPSNSYLNWSLGNQYAALGDWYKAQQAYSQAIKTEPENPDYHYNLAICLEYIQRYGEAQKQYAKALALAGNKPIHFDQQKAVERLDRLKDVSP